MWEAQIFKNGTRVLVLSPTAAALHRACRWVTLFLATNTEGSIHLLLTSTLPPHLCECLGSCRVQTFAHAACVACPVSPNFLSLLAFLFFVVTAGGVTDWPIKHHLRVRVTAGKLLRLILGVHRQHPSTAYRPPNSTGSRVTAVAASYSCCRM